MGSRHNVARAQHYQFVQGGIERNDKDVVAAALREIQEEVGLTSAEVTFVQEVLPPSGDPKEFRYRLAPESNLRRRHGYEGQEQRMVLFFAPSSAIQRVVLIPPPTMKGSPQQEFDEVRWMTFAELLDKGHPEKLVLFEKLSLLTPPVMEVFLASRNPPLDAASSSSRALPVSSTHDVEGHGERERKKKGSGDVESGGNPTVKNVHPFREESGGGKVTRSEETSKMVSHM